MMIFRNSLTLPLNAAQTIQTTQTTSALLIYFCFSLNQLQARVYLLSSGFSLAFGSMFAKTYRVHRIFTHSGGGVCKDKMLRDTQLISLVCALLLLDGLVVTLWVIADPMERHLSNLTLEISSTDRSVVYQPQVK